MAMAFIRGSLARLAKIVWGGMVVYYLTFFFQYLIGWGINWLPITMTAPSASSFFKGRGKKVAGSLSFLPRLAVWISI